jgi:hypothetical protein
MLVFEDAIVISLRPDSVSFAMRLRSRPTASSAGAPVARRVDCIGLRTLILALPGVLTIAALLHQFGTPRRASAAEHDPHGHPQQRAASNLSAHPRDV